MFVTDPAGSVYCAKLDRSDAQVLLATQGNLSSIRLAGLMHLCSDLF